MAQFKVGDFLSAKGAIPKRVGRVVKVYEIDGKTRIVVRFEDGSESVFFALELVAAEKAADQFVMPPINGGTKSPVR